MPWNALAGPAIATWTTIGISPMAAPMRTGRRVGGWRQSSHANTSATATIRSGRNVRASPASRPATSRQRRREAGSATCSPRTAKTALHRVRASAPFQAIAVRATGVRT